MHVICENQWDRRSKMTSSKLDVSKKVKRQRKVQFKYILTWHMTWYNARHFAVRINATSLFQHNLSIMLHRCRQPLQYNELDEGTKQQFFKQFSRIFYRQDTVIFWIKILWKPPTCIISSRSATKKWYKVSWKLCKIAMTSAWRWDELCVHRRN